MVQTSDSEISKKGWVIQWPATYRQDIFLRYIYVGGAPIRVEISRNLGENFRSTLYAIPPEFVSALTTCWLLLLLPGCALGDFNFTGVNLNNPSTTVDVPGIGEGPWTDWICHLQKLARITTRLYAGCDLLQPLAYIERISIRTSAAFTYSDGLKDGPQVARIFQAIRDRSNQQLQKQN